MMAPKKEGREEGGMDGWMDRPTGGRNGSVLEGGSCESLVPRFHQRVQIWRHLLFSRPAADQGENWRGEGEGEKKKKNETDGRRLK